MRFWIIGCWGLCSSSLPLCDVVEAFSSLKSSSAQRRGGSPPVPAPLRRQRTLMPPVATAKFVSGTDVSDDRMAASTTDQGTPNASPVSDETAWSSSSSWKSSSSSRWDSFDYLQHWYPVSWLVDLPKGQPVKLTLFDVDYAVAVRAEENDGKTVVTALKDECPHRAAALSEGRMTETGYLQCAYHGWSFDKEGRCVQIPQAAEGAEGAVYGKRAHAEAVPAVVHQGMVWIWPGPVTERDGNGEPLLPTPPSVPQLDQPGWAMTPIVRDFPDVDWTLLISNILDPDHGMFAHQFDSFDMYSASRACPMRVEERFERDGVSWSMHTRVSAKDKLKVVDRLKRGDSAVNKRMTRMENVTANSIWDAPSLIRIFRTDDGTNETKFVSCFWICPTGTGRSRFMSSAVYKGIPFRIPRWLNHIGSNNFLDQDTLLVASQQPATLQAEAQAHEVLQETGQRQQAREGLFSYSSPTDRSVRLIDQFWDSTLHRVPGRAAFLKEMRALGLLKGTKTRSTVLDRKRQNLDICPDSQDAVKNLSHIRLAGFLGAAAWLTVRLTTGRLAQASWLCFPILSTVVGWIAGKMRSEFYFKYTAEMRNRDLRNIPKKTWVDPPRE